MVNTADQQYMQLAMNEAFKAGERGEVPVGAVLVDRAGDILAADGNRTIEYRDPSGHAEMVVLRAAGRRLDNYRLPGTTLYVTIEPCVMCAGAMVHARIERLVFGAEDPKAGGVVSRYAIGVDGLLNHRLSVDGGSCAEECGALLKNFFKQRREQQKNLL
jgi:tRNA(adenine34) deaminase